MAVVWIEVLDDLAVVVPVATSLSFDGCTCWGEVAPPKVALELEDVALKRVVDDIVTVAAEVAMEVDDVAWLEAEGEKRATPGTELRPPPTVMMASPRRMPATRPTPKRLPSMLTHLHEAGR